MCYYTTILLLGRTTEATPVLLCNSFCISSLNYGKSQEQVDKYPMPHRPNDGHTQCIISLQKTISNITS